MIVTFHLLEGHMQAFSFYSKVLHRRAIALVLAVLLLGVPILEAGHSHAQEDNYEHCLLCKHSATPAASGQPGPPDLIYMASATWQPASEGTSCFSFLSPAPRGPPLHS